MASVWSQKYTALVSFGELMVLEGVVGRTHSWGGGVLVLGSPGWFLWKCDVKQLWVRLRLQSRDLVVFRQDLPELSRGASNF